MSECDLFSLHDSTLRDVVDKFIPQHRIRCRYCANAPWVDPECRILKCHARMWERRYRCIKSSSDRQACVDAHTPQTSSSQGDDGSVLGKYCDEYSFSSFNATAKHCDYWSTSRRHYGWPTADKDLDQHAGMAVNVADRRRRREGSSVSITAPFVVRGEVMAVSTVQSIEETTAPESSWVLVHRYLDV